MHLTSLVSQTVKCLQCGRLRFNPWVGKILWRRKRQPTPVPLPGKSHGGRSLVGYGPWGRKKSDTTERLNKTKGEKDLNSFFVISIFLCLPFSFFFFLSSLFISQFPSFALPLSALQCKFISREMRGRNT